MKRLAVVLALLLLIVPAVQAQTATPTVNPHVFYAGAYNFGFESPRITWSGPWYDQTVGQNDLRGIASASAYYAIITVSDTVCTAVITGFSTATSGWEINVDGNLFPRPNSSVSEVGMDQPVFRTNSGGGTYQIKIYPKSSGGIVRLYNFWLFECSGTPVPSITPPNTPVPTATILPSSTPGVPTATILPSSTPANTPVDTPTEIVFPATPTEIVFPATPTEINTPVDTPTEIVFPATPTEINTPVDTPTEINIDPTIAALMTLIAGGPTPDPNTPTPSDTPTITNTPTPEPRSCATLPVSGQMACFDYVATSSDVHIGNLITLIFFSVWGFFLFAVLVLWRRSQ